MVRCLIDLAQVLLRPFRTSRPFPVAESGSRTLDGVHRRAQFVGHRREEGGLALGLFLSSTSRLGSNTMPQLSARDLSRGFPVNTKTPGGRTLWATYRSIHVNSKHQLGSQSGRQERVGHLPPPSVYDGSSRPPSRTTGGLRVTFTSPLRATRGLTKVSKYLHA